MKRLYNTLFIISFSCVSTAAFGMNQENQINTKEIPQNVDSKEIPQDKQADVLNTTAVKKLLTGSGDTINPSKIEQPAFSLKSYCSQLDVASSLSNFTNQFTTRQKVQTTLCAGVIVVLAYYLATNVQF